MTTVAVAALIALWATALGEGPFGHFAGNTALVLSQVFVSVLAISGLMFAALRSEGARALETIQDQHRELATLDAVKDHLLSSISHEIKTPLSLIKGNAELLEDRLPDAQEVKGILNGADRLARHVDQIIDYGALVGGTIKLYTGVLPLDEIIEGVVATADHCRSRDLDIRVKADPTTPPVLGDSRRLAQLLEALVDNACKYSPDKGLVEIELGHSNGEVFVTVSDQGPGIPASDRGRIWRPFEQQPGGAGHGHGGIGLGLPIAQAIARLHGGEIGVDCPGGRGCRFTFRMPQAPEGRFS